MGRKSREKKERTRLRQGYGGQGNEISSETKKPFLVNFIFVIVSLTLFAPFVINKHFYFPFVGLKGLVIMAGAQIAFFSWLFLILKHKEYRPKLNSILIALTIFLIVLILASVLGVDFSRSFWSKYERMTGLLVWLHLFALFLVISSTFKKVSDWKKLFTVSVLIGIVISFMALFELAGIEKFKFADRGGSTLGNTSFLGTYLLFNVFFAIWLAFQKKKHEIGWKSFYLLGAGLMLLIIYLVEAKAASIAGIGGIGLIFLLWLSFRGRKKSLKILGRIALTFSSLVILIGLVLLFISGSFVQEKFIQMTGKARVVNWQMATEAIKERPVLGWGPENYTLAFNKFFNPCFFLEECGTEIWFDRVHNIIFDTLVTVGIIGFISYLALFVALFYVFTRSYQREKSLDFWTFSIFPALLISYFIQNLTVFDMTVSLLMFILVLGFAGFLSSRGKKKETRVLFSSRNKQITFGIILVLVFSLSFYNFIIQPFKTDYLTIKSFHSRSFPERIEYYGKALEASPLGKYQIREFFAERSQSIVKDNVEEIIKDEEKLKWAKRELDAVIGGLEKTAKESPLDYRTILRLANIHNVYYLIDKTKLGLAQEYGNMAIELSPTNQQGYWALAQAKALERDFDRAIELAKQAIDLEPKLFLSYSIALNIAEVSGNIEKAKEIAEKAVKVNPNWEFQIKDVTQ